MKSAALVLFDIDGTLLLSGGAGVRSMTLAFADVFGVPDAFAAISVAGRTDSFLVATALQHAGLPDTPVAHEKFRARYLELLAEEIRKPGDGRRGLMPGALELLSRLAEHESCHRALLTGNYAPAAHVKLSHFGIDHFFSWGAFGEDSSDRNELARVALARAVDQGVPIAARANVVVIGDTPHDVDCARAIGARVIAVATGAYSAQALQATDADAVIDDLGDAARVIEFITCA